MCNNINKVLCGTLLMGNDSLQYRASLLTRRGTMQVQYNVGMTTGKLPPNKFYLKQNNTLGE